MNALNHAHNLLFEYGIAHSDPKAVALLDAARAVDTVHGDNPLNPRTGAIDIPEMSKAHWDAEHRLRQADSHRAEKKRLGNKLYRLKTNSDAWKRTMSEIAMHEQVLNESIELEDADRDLMSTYDAEVRRVEAARSVHDAQFTAAEEGLAADDVVANYERLRDIQYAVDHRLYYRDALLDPSWPNWVGTHAFHDAVGAWRKKAEDIRDARLAAERAETGFASTDKSTVQDGVHYTYRPDINVSADAADAIHEATLLAAAGERIPQALRDRMMAGGVSEESAKAYSERAGYPAAREMKPWRFEQRGWGRRPAGLDHVNPAAISVTTMDDDGMWVPVDNWGALKAEERRKALNFDSAALRAQRRRSMEHLESIPQTAVERRALQSAVESIDEELERRDEPPMPEADNGAGRARREAEEDKVTFDANYAEHMGQRVELDAPDARPPRGSRVIEAEAWVDKQRSAASDKG